MNEAVIIIPSVLFLAVVTPIWLTLHYKHKSRMSEGISDQDVERIEDMLVLIDKLTDRIDTLEQILDKDQPSWHGQS